MKGIAHEVEGLEFSVADGEAGRIRLAVLDGSDLQSLLGGRMRDQFNHRFQRGERFGPPIDGNERKEAVLELVPLAGGRWVKRARGGGLFFLGPRSGRPVPPII